MARGHSSSILLRKQNAVRRKMKRLRLEMEEINIDQKQIRKDQRDLRGKLEHINEQCVQLRQEMEVVAKQKARNQLLLNLTFRVLKARQAGDFATAISLTRILRQVIQNRGANEGNASDDIK
ncbi:hypothetical protein SLEP1_g21385 [Rubroshorea leprosula]|uniref:Uncharacterized protein n=1 Tax=Rubroshorea leprosula TaxID=152421 RepID=A0AAV5JD69_9ROSI|nr:hypothetical protein SLEP1_g21385 [Rubroshorea leprosula]